jgi:murein DD-endopeptidase MepM/ murein hydrolase activator NlpD
MKLWVKLILLVLALGLGLSGYIYYEQKQLEASEIQSFEVNFNGTPIEFLDLQMHKPILGSLLTLNYYVHQDGFNDLDSDQMLNTFRVDPRAIVTITNDAGENIPYQESLVLEPGRYSIVVNIMDGIAQYDYLFHVDVDPQPKITLSDLEPSQGGLVIIDIENVSMNTDIEVISNFKPSAIHRTAHSAQFYLPMAYQSEAKNYALQIIVGEDVFDYALDVQTYVFKESHFTVPVSVSSGTVGNQDAVLQYREAIYPTYESYVEDVYWEGSFILPVEGARISSTFGEKRFVNNAANPTRHSGIDYAIACGTEVYASNAGVVEFADFLIMIGNTIVIDHGLGLKTYYEHLDDIMIKAGDIVEKGQLIGHVGTTGYSTGCHLHFQAMVKNQSINPDVLYTLE